MKYSEDYDVVTSINGKDKLNLIEKIESYNVLVEVVNRCIESIRTLDIFGRYSEEEFL